jgi:hypothetical protein
MEDKQFDDLKLRMAITPQQAKWPEPRFNHWEKLHAVPDEARRRVAKAFAAMSEVDNNPDLTAEGKAKARQAIATKAIAAAQSSKALQNAREAVTRQQQLWADKFGSLDQVVKPADDFGTVALHAQIREC